MQMIRFRKILPLTLAGLLCVCLFTMPHVCTAGVKEGVLLCGTTILPSLFPFMAISGFLLETGSGLLRGKWVTRITKRLFRLPGESASVILMAMIGGFPIGAKMTAQLLESRRITQNQAMRMCLFCINAGPAFVISAVGYSLFKSVRAGVILYSSMCLAALLCGMLCSFFDDGTPIPIEKTRAPSHGGTAVSLVRAVHGATDAMLNICAWIILFTCIGSCVDHAPLPENVKLVLHCVLEVTDGVSAAAYRLPLPAIAAILSFSGLSVHCQIMQYLQVCGVKLAHFWACRGVCAALSCAVCAMLLRIFPCEVTAFASSGGLVGMTYSVSIPSFAALMLMSILLILEVEPPKKVW